MTTELLTIDVFTDESGIVSLDRVEAELARASVTVQAMRAEAARWQRCAEALQARLDALESPEERERRSNRTRQADHRRRHRFAAPAIETP